MSLQITQTETSIRNNISENLQRVGNTGKLIIESSTPHDVSANRRNLLINGDMSVWQRGTSFTGGNNFTADRWHKGNVGWTIERSTDVPIGEGFTYSMRCFGNAPDPRLQQKIVEGAFKFPDNVLTISYWAKVITGGFHEDQFLVSGNPFVSQQWTNDEIYSPEWKRYSHTIRLSDIHDTSIGYLAPRLDFVANTDFELYITGIQCEVGSVLTEFDQVTIAETIEACHQYYQKSYDLDDTPGTATSNGVINESATRNAADSTTGVHFNSTMIKIPTIAVYSSDGTLGFVANGGNKAGAAVDVASSGFSRVTITSGLTASSALYHFTATAEI